MSLLGCTSSGTNLNNNNQTLLNDSSVIDSGGTIYQWCIYIGLTGGQTYSAKLKIFRDDGTNFNFVGESSLESCSNGLNTFNTSIVVQAGDLVGIYQTRSYAADGVNVATSGTYAYGKDGDITSNSTKATWNQFPAPNNWSFRINATIGQNNVYINTSTGNDANAGDSCAAGHPVLTFGKAYSLLASGGTIHVCNSGADLSTETVTRNKSYSMTVDGDGYWYGAKGS